MQVEDVSIDMSEHPLNLRVHGLLGGLMLPAIPCVCFLVFIYTCIYKCIMYNLASLAVSLEAVT